ncbi:hypothetical protein HDU87_008140 [Geranomyces variabilis]|uniref:G-protein coupled receptors family 3 profile domain-containing protein n=1 Tax=Geranomyces variabilis TaxID=109894 RepID=A0AAD5XMC4_9FUNG|nr:hypothetical protein HDU87_008140 [Geranomyces variabilis]
MIGWGGFFQLLCFFELLSCLVAQTEIYVDTTALSSGDGSAFNPWQTMDAALLQAQQDTSGDSITIFLESPGEYPLNQGSYDFGAIMELAINGTDGWSGSEGPMLVRGPGVSGTSVQFNITNSFTVTNVAMGLPEDDVSGLGTHFRFYFTDDALFSGYLTFDNVTFNGGSNPDFDTRRDVLSISVEVSESIGNTIISTDCKVRPGLTAIRNVQIEGNIALDPKRWCASVFSAQSSLGGEVDGLGRIFEMDTYERDAVMIPMTNIRLINCTVDYPNAVDVVESRYQQTIQPPTDLILVTSTSNASLAGFSSTGSSGPVTVLGIFQISNATITNHKPSIRGVQAIPPYLFAVSAAANFVLFDTVIASGVASPIMQCNGTSATQLSACVLVNEMGSLEITSTQMNHISADDAVFQLERSETDLNRPATMISESIFQDISETLFSGTLSTLYVEASVVQNCSGASAMEVGDLSIFHFSDCLFVDNYTPKDGAVLNSVFENNTATGGGALCIDYFDTELNLMLVNVSFINNTASSHGGAWWTLERQRLDDNFASVTYSGNFAPSMPVRGSASATFVPYGDWSKVSLLAGASLPSFGISTNDAYEQPVTFELETAPVVTVALTQADSAALLTNTAVLYGPTVSVVDSGNLTLSNLRVFGPAGDFLLKLIDDSGTEIPDFDPLYRQVTIKSCDWPMQLLTAAGTPELECRPPICPLGCSSTAGVCVADSNCTCTDTSYEGISCQILKSANDSLTFAFPAGVPIFTNSSDVVTFTVDGRDQLISRVKKAYSATYTVIYRDFRGLRSSNSSLTRRDASGDTLYLKFSLADLVTGNFLDYLQLAKVSTIFTQTLDAPYRAGITTTIGALANTTIDSVGSILVIIISCVCIMTALSLAGALYIRPSRPPLGATTRNFDMALPCGLAVLFAFPITETMIPTATSCALQIWLIPPSFGLIAACLVAKSFSHYARRKNKIALEAELPERFRKILILAIGVLLSVYVVCVAIWYRIEAPTPQLTYLGGMRFWSCGGTAHTQNCFIISLICFSGTLHLAACKFSYETFKVGWPVHALEDKMILGNATNVLITGVVAAGILMANMMDGVAQFALRATAVYLVGAGLTATLLGYKVFMLVRPAGSEEDALDARIRAFAQKSAKSGSIYQNSKYLPVKEESALIWKAAQITIAQSQSLLDITDLDSKIGRFHAIQSVGVDTDIASICLLLQIPGFEQLRVQMDSKRMLEDWVKKIADAKRQAPATKTNGMVPATDNTPLLTVTMEDDT